MENKENLTGGLADSKTISDIAKHHAKGNYKLYEFILDELKNQLQIGMKVELEHTSLPHVAREIVKDHLMEDYLYYSKLKNAGL